MTEHHSLRIPDSYDAKNRHPLKHFASDFHTKSMVQKSKHSFLDQGAIDLQSHFA